MTPTIPGLPGNSVEKEPTQEPGRTASGSRLDIAAIKKRCEATPAREAFETWCTINISKIHADALDEAAMGFAAGWEAARTDLPAALEALEEAQAEITSLKADLAFVKHAALGD